MIQKRRPLARALTSLTPPKLTKKNKIKVSDLCTTKKEVATLTTTTCGAVLLEHLLSSVDSSTGLRGDLLTTLPEFIEARTKQLVKEFKSKLSAVGLALRQDCFFSTYLYVT